MRKPQSGDYWYDKDAKTWKAICPTDGKRRPLVHTYPTIQLAQEHAKGKRYPTRELPRESDTHE